MRRARTNQLTRQVRQGIAHGMVGRKDADPDIPVLKEAKAEYTKLQ